MKNLVLESGPALDRLFLLRDLLQEFVASAKEMQPPHAAYLVGTVPKDWPDRVKNACSLADCFTRASDD